MKNQVFLTIAFILLLTSMVQADNTMVLNFDHYDGPSEYAQGEFVKGAVQFQNDNPKYTAVVLYIYPENFGMSVQAADARARTFYLILKGNGVRTASFRSVHGAEGQSCYQIVWEPPVSTPKAIRRIGREEVDRIKQPTIEINPFGYAIGSVPGSAKGGLGLGMTINEPFGVGASFTFGFGAFQGGSVYPGGDETQEKIGTVNNFARVGAIINVLHVDSDNAGWFFNFAPTISGMYTAINIDGNGDFGLVGSVFSAGAQCKWGWISSSHDFMFDLFIEPGIGIGRWQQSGVRPVDETAEKVSYLASPSIIFGVGFAWNLPSN